MLINQKRDTKKSRRLWLKLAMGILVAPCALAAQADPNVSHSIHQLDITLIDGSVISRSQLQGKVVIYLFWATWCPVCVGEMGRFEALRNKYKEQGLELLAISLDRDADEVRAFRARKQYQLPMAMRSDELRHNFGNIRGTPTIFIVDRTSTLRVKHLGAFPAQELERMVATLL